MRRTTLFTHRKPKDSKTQNRSENEHSGVSKINIHVLSDGDDDLSFKLKDFKLPITLEKDHIEVLLKDGFNNDKIPFGMYC